MGELAGSEVNSVETTGKIQKPTEMTLKCQWVIEESSRDGSTEGDDER